MQEFAAPVRSIEIKDSLFPGFRLLDVPTQRGNIRVRTGGGGPPLLLLHGYPQTHAMWHKVTALLKDRFEIICMDLPGYGDSHKPRATPDHAAHSKRAMANDIVEAMQALGHRSWFVGSHDRGARVAHRMGLDHPDCVLRIVTLDIAPTREMYAQATDAFARAYWHWYFLILPAPFPERLIGADPEFFWRRKCGTGSAGLSPFSEEALAEYLRCFANPDVIAGSCEDYRAAASIDIAHDCTDESKKLEMPLLAIWGSDGIIGKCFDPLALWRMRAKKVDGFAMEGGHYLAEECPERVADAFDGFFLRR